MVDREKVIYGLEIQLDDLQKYADNDQPLTLTQEQAQEIISLLKEQEPRILDWDEIKNYSVVYGEFRDVKEIYPLIITVDDWGRCLSWNPGINVSDEFLLLVSDEEDRRNTRCWDKMPTEEQRQAVKWE